MTALVRVGDGGNGEDSGGGDGSVGEDTLVTAAGEAKAVRPAQVVIAADVCGR